MRRSTMLRVHSDFERTVKRLQALEQQNGNNISLVELTEELARSLRRKRNIYV